MRRGFIPGLEIYIYTISQQELNHHKPSILLLYIDFIETLKLHLRSRILQFKRCSYKIKQFSKLAKKV